MVDVDSEVGILVEILVVDVKYVDLVSSVEVAVFVEVVVVVLVEV